MNIGFPLAATMPAGFAFFDGVRYYDPMPYFVQRINRAFEKGYLNSKPVWPLFSPVEPR